MSAAPFAAQLARFSEKGQLEQRSHQRYAIELELEYRLLGRHRGGQLGTGKTVNISSGGVLFETAESPLLTGPIELMMNWPFLLEGVCPLKLMMRGRVVRCQGRKVAIASKQHEFRTAGSAGDAKPRQAKS
jgi:PilZ domain